MSKYRVAAYPREASTGSPDVMYLNLVEEGAPLAEEDYWHPVSYTKFKTERLARRVLHILPAKLFNWVDSKGGHIDVQFTVEEAPKKINYGYRVGVNVNGAPEPNLFLRLLHDGGFAWGEEKGCAVFVTKEGAQQALDSLPDRLRKWKVGKKQVEATYTLESTPQKRKARILFNLGHTLDKNGRITLEYCDEDDPTPDFPTVTLTKKVKYNSQKHLEALTAWRKAKSDRKAETAREVANEKWRDAQKEVEATKRGESKDPL